MKNLKKIVLLLLCVTWIMSSTSSCIVHTRSQSHKHKPWFQHKPHPKHPHHPGNRSPGKSGQIHKKPAHHPQNANPGKGGHSKKQHHPGKGKH